MPLWRSINQSNHIKLNYMAQRKQYINGMTEGLYDWQRAKDLLVRAGRYSTMNNFGPYFPNKGKRLHRVLEVFVLEGMEFTIVETEVRNFSFTAMAVSQAHLEVEAWFQPLNKDITNC